MKYQIVKGHKGDMWFVTVDNLIVQIRYSVKAAQEWIETRTDVKSEDN